MYKKGHMDGVHELLQLADGHFQNWQAAVAVRTKIHRELQAAEKAGNEPSIISELTRKVTEADVEATVNVRMLRHCVRVADDIAKRI